MNQSYLSELNEAQRAAVEATEGPVMVIAGAGSGKTRVLTYRIAHLIQGGVDAFSILALTFTNKAAREMKERIAQVVGTSEAKNIWMGTFHSVFARILRVEAPLIGYPSNFTIYDQQDALNVMKKVIQDLQLDKDVYKPKQLLYRVSQFKNNLITVRSYFNNPELIEADEAAMRPRTGDIYKAYVERCFKSGGMDFDDLLLRTNEILTRFPEVLAKYQDRFKYILVDEYQDTNHSQYLIVKALASRFENLCVVGDDAQSIYAFRGANIRNMLSFQKDYADAQVFPLEQNYRSTQNIVEAANSVISNNREQLKKDVWTANEKGNKINVYRALSDADESRHVASRIFEMQMNEQLKPTDFAILYRTNAQSRALEEALRYRNIPYRVFGGISFYQRKEVKDLIAYLRLLINPNDQEAILRIINYPTRGIGQTTVNKLLIGAEKFNINVYDLVKNIPKYFQQIGLNKGTAAKIQAFGEMMQSFELMLKDKDVYQLADYVAKTTGLIKALNADDTPEGISRLENVQELINSMRGFVEEQMQLDDGDPSLAYFLENIALATDADNAPEDEEKVALMTVHLAKGLEFNTVFIVGLEENLFPSMMSMNTRQELEEERRLFYVALTRAEKVANLSFSVTRFRWGKLVESEPSRFLDELDQSYVDLENPESMSFKNNSGLSADVFGTPSKPAQRKPTPRKIKAEAEKQYQEAKTLNNETIRVGQNVLHERFGKGEILILEGEGQNLKAKVFFDNEGEKKLVLRFAKLKVLD